MIATASVPLLILHNAPQSLQLQALPEKRSVHYSRASQRLQEDVRALARPRQPLFPDDTPKNYQLLAQEEILGLKPRSTCEPRPGGKQQLVRNATIGHFITIRPRARHPG